jgi:multidrug efflux pump subunit AcrA (membrane-fusion protein)
MRTLIVFLLVIVVLAGGGLLVTKYLKAATVDVPTVAARRGEFVVKTYTRGDMQTLNSSVVFAPNVGSTLVALHLASTGEWVKEGDIIMEFDSSELDNTLEANLATVAQQEQSIVSQKARMAITAQQDKVSLVQAKQAVARAELDVRTNPLISEIDARKNDLTLEAAKKRLAQLEEDIQGHQETAQADLAVAQEQLNAANFTVRQTRSRLARLQVKSTLSGLVSVRQNQRAAGGFQVVGVEMPEFREGDSISSGDPVMDIVDTEQMEVAGKVTETSRGYLHEGQEVNIYLDSIPGETFPGKVKSLSGMTSRDFTGIDPTKTFGVVFSLTKQDSRLRPGMSAQVEIITDRVPDMVYVPLQAVFEKEGQQWVFVKAPDGQFRRIAVTTGARSESQVIIESGLKGSEQVALLDPEARQAAAAKRRNPLGSPMGGK